MVFDFKHFFDEQCDNLKTIFDTIHLTSLSLYLKTKLLEKRTRVG